MFKRRKNKLFHIIALFVCFGITKQQNATRARSGHRDSGVLSAIQHLQLQLNALESESQRQGSRLQEVVRQGTLLGAQRQELAAVLDRADARMEQRLSDIGNDVRKIMTLQDIMREDLEKIQLNQLLTKARIDELRTIEYKNSASKPETDVLLTTNSEFSATLQLLQSGMQSLRKMADTLQSSMSTIQLNVSDVVNITKLIYNHGNEALVTKSYLQSAIQIVTSDLPHMFPIIEVASSTSIKSSEEGLAKDCFDVQQRGESETGIYRIQPTYARRAIFVYCDMETDEGGWTVFQRRRDGSVDFLREWQDYKHGFGNVGTEFWLGNENVHLLTHQGLYELRVELQDFEDGRSFAVYSGFAVGSEREKYMLKLLGPLSGGDAGDGLTYHAAMPFSTIDIDNDRWEGGHCARDHQGGWWYNQCDASNLNGRYLNGLNPKEYQGIYWHEWHGPNYSLMSSSMMIRPIRKKKDPPAHSQSEDKVDVEGVATEAR